MIKSIAIKRCACILLCLILVFDCTYTKKQEADAFAFVLTPAIAQCIITGLAITGVIISSESFQYAASNFWNTASAGVKEYFHRVSTGAKYLADKTVQFSTNSMEYFKQYVLKNYSKDGGTISDTIGTDKSDMIDLNSFHLSGKLYTPTLLNGNSVIHLKDNLYLYLGENVNEECKLAASTRGNFWFVRKSKSPTFSTETAYLSIYENGVLYRSSNRVFDLTYTDGILTSLKFSFNQIGDVEFFFTDGLFNLKENTYEFYSKLYSYFVYSQFEGTSTISYDYSINSTAYPGTGSVCPDVPIDTVLDVPAVNSNDVINTNTADDLLGGATSVPFNPTVDIPDIGVAPPISPPADGILGFLENIWSSIKAIPQSISTSFERFFDVTQFKLDFSPLKNAGIQNKFPFCIPFDLYNVLKTVLKPGEVDFHVKLDTIYFSIDYMLPIHLPIFQLIRNFFRWSCLFGFIISLISGTRNLIKW